MTRRGVNPGDGPDRPVLKTRSPNVRIALAPTRLGGPRSFASIAAVLAVWILVGTGAAQPRPDVTLWIPADSVRAGEPFDLVIEGSTPAHRGIAFPSATVDSAFGDLEVLRRSDVHTRQVGNWYAIDSVAYTVKTSARDSVRIPPVPIRVDAAVGTLTTFTVPRTVRITDPRGGSSSRVVEEPSGPVAWWVLIGLVAAGLGGGIYLWGRFRHGNWDRETDSSEEPSAATDADSAAYEAAVHQLRTLQTSNVAEPDAVEAFYVALADVLRTYVSRRWDIATEGRTTQELVRSLDRQADLPSTVVERLQRILEEADRVKFAGARPSPSTAEETLQTARAVLDALGAAPASKDPSEEAAPPSDPDAASR